MASIDGIQLGVSESLEAGAGLRLSGPAPTDFTWGDDGTTVELTKDATFLVVRLEKQPTNLDALLALSHEKAQIALDLLAATQRHFVGLPGAHGEHLLWWRSPAGTTIRYTDTARMGVRVEVSWELRRASDGSVERSSDQPLPEWHPAMRYFRYSQLRDDLYASYREAFLAVEAYLSTLAPKQPGERERDWHVRANRGLEVAGVDFSSLVAPGVAPSDPVEVFVDDQFKAHRCALFHAKADQPHFLPGALTDRRVVADALERLGRYLGEVGRRGFGIDTGVGVMTFAGMEMHVDTFASDLTLAASPDDTPVGAEDVDVSPKGMSVTWLPTDFLGVVDGLGYEYGFLGSIAVASMADPVVNTLASRVPDALMTRGNVPLLDLSGAK